MAVFMGFSSAMLGVSGYETSAQFVESMHPGVFVKTLRNLWVGVTLVNPLLSFLAISVLPLNDITANRFVHALIIRQTDIRLFQLDLNLAFFSSF